MTPEEVIALAAEVGTREAARRSGVGKSTVDRWRKNGPPVPREPKPPAAPREPKVRPAPVIEGGGEKEGGETTAPDAEADPSSRARDPVPVQADAGQRDGTSGTDPRKAWRAEWRRKGEPVVPAPPRLAKAPEPSEVPQDERLSPAQNVALHLLLCGYHHSEIAAAMGLTEWQLLAWRRDATFREVHKAALVDVQALALESGVAWGAAAMDELFRIGMDPNVPVRVRGLALATYLDRCGYAKTKPLPLVKGEATGGALAAVPSERLAEEERAAREELQLLQGGKG